MLSRELCYVEHAVRLRDGENEMSHSGGWRMGDHWGACGDFYSFCLGFLAVQKTACISQPSQGYDVCTLTPAPSFPPSVQGKLGQC